jgi:hypothetical protein
MDRQAAFALTRWSNTDSMKVPQRHRVIILMNGISF